MSTEQVGDWGVGCRDRTVRRGVVCECERDRESGNRERGGSYSAEAVMQQASLQWTSFVHPGRPAVERRCWFFFSAAEFQVRMRVRQTGGFCLVPGIRVMTMLMVVAVR